MGISAKCMQEILDESSEAIYVTDMDYRILYANKVALETGRRLFKSRMNGEKCYQCLLGQDTPCSFCKMDQLSGDKYLVRDFHLPSGQSFELRGKIINWEGRPAHIEYIRNITERAESESRLNHILNNISGGIAVYQIHPDTWQAKRLMYTDGLLTMQGFSRQEYEELGGEDAMNLVYPEDRELLARELETNCLKQSAFSITYRVRHKEKGYIWVNLTANPIGRDSDGYLRYNAVFTNASHQFELYRQMLDNSGNGLIVSDRKTKEIYFSNRVAKGFLGGEDDREIGRLFPPEEGGPRKVQLKGRTWQVYTHFMEWMDRPAAAQYFSDITEETELQSKLTVGEERYRLVVEMSGIALMDYDLKTDQIYTNDCFRQYAASELPELRSFVRQKGCLEMVYPEDKSHLVQFYQTMSKQDAAAIRLRLKMRDGSFHWTELSALLIRNEEGQIVRKIGFLRDVDDVVRQYEDLRIRYDYEMTRQNSFEDGVVERILLDLTEDRVIQAANPGNASLPRLIGMSVEDLLKARLTRARGKKEKEELCGFMNREALLQAYYTGAHLTLGMLARVPGQEEKRYYLTSAQMAKNPGNGHITAFIETRDRDRSEMESTLMRRLLETNYESAVVMNAASGKIKIGIGAGDTDFVTDIESTYDELMWEAVWERVAEDEKKQTAEQMSLAMIRSKLEKNRICSGRAALKLGTENAYKMWTAVYFDDAREYILLTLADVTEVYKKDLQTARELKEALEAARVASRAKNTFLARMSHEIRTPITTVSGIMDLMRLACQKKEIRTEELLAQIETADAANQYLLTLINDILDISKIESNDLSLSPVPVDMREVIEPVCAMIKPLAIKKKVHFRADIRSQEEHWYRVDSVRVQQILINLLNNAIKFTPENGLVHFTGEIREMQGNQACVQFVVSDTGVGISDSFRDSVFEPFRQEYTDSRSGYGGTGIGLSISRKLAQMMGGDITFESEKGKGSVFTVTLWLERVTAAEEQKSQTREKGMVSLNGIHVLLCEDNEINQMIIQQLLMAGGCTVTAVDDGLEAVETFAASAEGTFDFILMDIQMPVMGGLEATRQIRSLPRADAGTVPVVAMSANAYEEDRQMSLDAGMNGHLSKPVDTEKLYQTIYESCRNRKL